MEQNMPVNIERTRMHAPVSWGCRMYNKQWILRAIYLSNLALLVGWNGSEWISWAQTAYAFEPILCITSFTQIVLISLGVPLFFYTISVNRSCFDAPSSRIGTVGMILIAVGATFGMIRIVLEMVFGPICALSVLGTGGALLHAIICTNIGLVGLILFEFASKH